MRGSARDFPRPHSTRSRLVDLQPGNGRSAVPHIETPAARCGVDRRGTARRVQPRCGSSGTWPTGRGWHRGGLPAERHWRTSSDRSNVGDARWQGHGSTCCRTDGNQPRRRPADLQPGSTDRPAAARQVTCAILQWSDFLEVSRRTSSRSHRPSQLQFVLAGQSRPTGFQGTRDRQCGPTEGNRRNCR